MNLGKQFKDGMLTQNPVLVQVLGMCSTMAITTSFFNGIGMGVAVTIILTPVSYTHLDVYKRQVVTQGSGGHGGVAVGFKQRDPVEADDRAGKGQQLPVRLDACPAKGRPAEVQ